MSSPLPFDNSNFRLFEEINGLLGKYNSLRKKLDEYPIDINEYVSSHYPHYSTYEDVYSSNESSGLLDLQKKLMRDSEKYSIEVLRRKYYALHCANEFLEKHQIDLEEYLYDPNNTPCPRKVAVHMLDTDDAGIPPNTWPNYWTKNYSANNSLVLAEEEKNRNIKKCIRDLEEKIDFESEHVEKPQNQFTSKPKSGKSNSVSGGKRVPSKKSVARNKKPKQQKEEKMAKEKTSDMFIKSVSHGGKVAAADEASEALLLLVQNLVGDAYPEIAKSEKSKDFLKVFAALGLHYVSTNYEVVPHAENVASACSLVIEASARDIIQPEMKRLTPVLARLAAVGGLTKTDNDDSSDKE